MTNQFVGAQLLLPAKLPQNKPELAIRSQDRIISVRKGALTTILA
jgi:hypothetical protein